jgi:hypothetical protein
MIAVHISVSFRHNLPRVSLVPGALSSGVKPLGNGVIHSSQPSGRFSAQADWTLTHTSYKNIEQSTIEASITLDGVTLTHPLIR